MKVQNDFPKADTVLRRLREYVSFFQEKLKTAKGEEAKRYQYYIKHASDYTSAIAAYLDSVCNDEFRIAKVRENAQSREEIQYYIERLDATRTSNHSAVIRTMISIDRTAVKFGLERIFGCAIEYETEWGCLTPSSIDEKKQMTEEQRIKRREMGNFGLYIAASVTAGMSRDYMISDDEARNFADCEGERQKTDSEVYSKVKSTTGTLKKNMEDIIEIG